MRKWLILFCLFNLCLIVLAFVRLYQHEQEIRVLVDIAKDQIDINKTNVTAKEDLYKILKKARR